MEPLVDPTSATRLPLPEALAKWPPPGLVTAWLGVHWSVVN